MRCLVFYINFLNSFFNFENQNHIIYDILYDMDSALQRDEASKPTNYINLFILIDARKLVEAFQNIKYYRNLFILIDVRKLVFLFCLSFLCWLSKTFNTIETNLVIHSDHIPIYHCIYRFF